MIDQEKKTQIKRFNPDKFELSPFPLFFFTLLSLLINCHYVPEFSCVLASCSSTFCFPLTSSLFMIFPHLPSFFITFRCFSSFFVSFRHDSSSIMSQQNSIFDHVENVLRIFIMPHYMSLLFIFSFSYQFPANHLGFSLSVVVIHFSSHFSTSHPRLNGTGKHAELLKCCLFVLFSFLLVLLLIVALSKTKRSSDSTCSNFRSGFANGKRGVHSPKTTALSFYIILHHVSNFPMFSNLCVLLSTFFFMLHVA